ncbi:MAG TPA: VWA domain-containing protein [Polyangiaceae bacterium]|nr:VWA domain-containing protein [Polyangiaceae bacterium]
MKPRRLSSLARALNPGSAPVAVRYAALSLVALAPFLPARTKPGQGRAVVYAVDRSSSVDAGGRAAAEAFVKEALEKRGDARVGVVAFDARPEIVVPLGSGKPLPPLGEAAGRGTDLEAAIDLAAAALPPAGERRVVVLSDGRPTRGDAEAAVRRAAARGIVVDALPVGEGGSAEARVGRVTASAARVAEGEPISVRAEIIGPPDQGVTVQWKRDGQPLTRTTVDTNSDGLALARFTDPEPGAGAHVYEAAVVEAPAHPTLRGYHGRHGAAPDAAAQADPAKSGRTGVIVHGKPRALVLSVDGECPAVLKDALERSQLAHETRSLVDGMDPAAVSGADLVVLADVPVARTGEAEGLSGLTPAQQETLVDYVRQKGGGLVVTGGTFGFAPEWAGAPIAKMLPVEVEDRGEAEDPRVALAIVLDRSGSMSMTVGSHTKIELAVEAGLAAAATLRPDDLLALGTVDTETHWDAPLGPVGLLAGRRAELRTIDAGGGGIYVFTALRDSYAELAKAPAPIRHVLLFSDTADSEEQEKDGKHSNSIAEEARRAGITTSVVGIGRAEDSDTVFLQKLALAGGGRFYLSGTGTDLRRIFVSETRVATRSNVHEGQTRVVVREPSHPALTGVDLAHVPALAGYTESRPRSTADVALETEDKRPLLASWRYGLGQVAALTADLRVDWKNGWSAWAGGGQIVRQLMRMTYRRQSENMADLRVGVRDKSFDVTLDLPAPQPGEAPAQPSLIEAFAINDKGESRPVKAEIERVADRRWALRGALEGEPFVVVRARDARGQLLGEDIGQLDTAAEHVGIGPDGRMLGELARAGGGVAGPTVDESLRRGGDPGNEPRPLWPYALVAAAALVAIDLWARRFELSARRRRLWPFGRRTKPAPLAPTLAPAPAPPGALALAQAPDARLPLAAPPLVPPPPLGPGLIAPGPQPPAGALGQRPVSQNLPLG